MTSLSDRVPAVLRVLGATARVAAPERAARPKHLKLSASSVILRALDRAGLTQTALADELQARRQVVQAWCDPDEPHAPTILHIAAAPTAFARPLLEWAAKHHGLALCAAGAVTHGDNTERSASITRACANALRAATLLPTATAEQLELFARDATGAIDALLEGKAYAESELAMWRGGR